MNILNKIFQFFNQPEEIEYQQVIIFGDIYWKQEFEKQLLELYPWFKNEDYVIKVVGNDLQVYGKYRYNTVTIDVNLKDSNRKKHPGDRQFQFFYDSINNKIIGGPILSE